MSLVEIKVPDIGDFKEVEVIEVLVKPGDRIAVDQSLITVESDKASMEIPSSQAGVVREMKVKLGDKVAEGSLLLMLETEGESQQAAPAAAAPAAAAPAPAPAPAAPVPAAPVAAAPAAGGGMINVEVPDIGDFKEVEVIEVLVKPGDTVSVDQSLITVESDKASMEIPSSHAGVVKELKVKLGDKVSKGSPLLMLETEGETQQAAPAAAPAAAAPVAPVLPAAAGPVSAPGCWLPPGQRLRAPVRALRLPVRERLRPRRLPRSGRCRPG